jgi:hypothetical protein
MNRTMVIPGGGSGSAAWRGNGDFWSGAARALGIRGSTHSPFRAIRTLEDARLAVRDAALILSLVGSIQLSLSWFAGVGKGGDAVVYLPLALLVYRFSSRLAAVALVAFAFFAVGVAVAAPFWDIEPKINLFFVGILLWSSLRAAESTFKLARRAAPRRGAASVAERTNDDEGRVERVAAGPFVVAAIALGAMAIAPMAAHRPSENGSMANAKAAKPRAAWTPSADAVIAEIGDQHVVLRPPDGFSEPRRDEREIASVADTFVPPAMELQALFVTGADLDAFRRDHRLSLGRYVMIQTLRSQKGLRVSREQFVKAKGTDAETSPAQSLGTLIGADAALTEWLGVAFRKAGEAAQLQGMQARAEGIIDETDRSVSAGSIVEVPESADGNGSSRVIVTSLVLARGKILVVYTYSPYASSEDAARAHAISREAVSNLLDENPV